MINRSLDSFISHDFSVNLPFHQLNTSKSDLVVFIVFSFFLFCKSLHPLRVPYCTFVSLQEGSWDDADGEFPDAMPSSQSDR